MKDLEVRFVDSHFGNKLAVIEGHLFRKDSQKQGGTWYCKCVSYEPMKCNARAIIKGYPQNPLATMSSGTHNHGTPDLSIWRYDAISVIKKLIQEQPTTTTNDILLQIQMTLDDPFGFYATQYTTLERDIRRLRAKNRAQTKHSLQEQRAMDVQHIKIPEHVQEQILVSQQQVCELQQRVENPNLGVNYP